MAQMVVHLNEVELGSALYAGILLSQMSSVLGLRDRVHSSRHSSLEITQLGIVGERVVAKALDLYWSGAAQTYTGADLSHDIEVRTTTHPDKGLKVRETDYDDKRIAGVFISDIDSGDYLVTGWILAGDAKREAYWVNPRGLGGYWRVPASVLRPIAELRDIIAAEKGERH